MLNNGYINELVGMLSLLENLAASEIDLNRIGVETLHVLTPYNTIQYNGRLRPFLYI